MTREEAIEILRKRQRYCKVIADHANETVKADELREVDAIDMAIAFLRPISREQVEKVWRGEWNNINPAVLKPGVSWVCRCAKCGCPQDYKHNFCQNCGAAQTDEAVEMVMERLEAMYEKT